MTKPIFIGITGASASGKTKFCEDLKAKFNAEGISCTIVNADHYYHHTPNLSSEERNRTNFCEPDAIDFELLEKHLQDLATGHTISRPCYNITTCSREETTLQLNPSQVILVEGLVIFSSDTIKDLCSLKIFINTKLDICLHRKLLRDKNDRHLSYDYIVDTYLELIRKPFLAHTFPFKKDPDFFVIKAEEARSEILEDLPKLVKGKCFLPEQLRCKL